jgi:hypothetical protein
MDKRIEALFRDYGKAFSELALQDTAQLYAATFIAAGPKGIISQTRKEFLANAAKAAEFYRSVGQKSAKALAMKETWYSKNYAMVTIHWGVTFETLDKPAEFDVSYLVQLTDDPPRIILFISHEDEAETMKRLGLLKSA